MSARSRPRRCWPPATRWSSSTISATGHRAAVPAGARLHVGTYADGDGLARLLETERIEAILHCAARSRVGESIANPSLYYRDNVAGGVALLEAARSSGVGRVVFSSSAAVYGVPDVTPIPEDAPLRPINPYGETKRTFETALAWYGRAYGLRSVSLRYFNVAGATATLGEVHDPESHLIPTILAAADGRDRADHLRRRLPDARRHLHPRLHRRRRSRRRAPARARGDRARRPAHRRRARAQPRQRRRLLGPPGPAAAEAVVGHPIPYRVGPRRAGDPPVLVAGAQRAAEVLGWRPASAGYRGDGRIGLGVAPATSGRFRGLTLAPGGSGSAPG